MQQLKTTKGYLILVDQQNRLYDANSRPLQQIPGTRNLVTVEGVDIGEAMLPQQPYQQPQQQYAGTAINQSNNSIGGVMHQQNMGGYSNHVNETYISGAEHLHDYQDTEPVQQTQTQPVEAVQEYVPSNKLAIKSPNGTFDLPIAGEEVPLLSYLSVTANTIHNNGFYKWGLVMDENKQNVIYEKYSDGVKETDKLTINNIKEIDDLNDTSFECKTNMKSDLRDIILNMKDVSDNTAFVQKINIFKKFWTDDAITYNFAGQFGNIEMLLSRLGSAINTGSRLIKNSAKEIDEILTSRMNTELLFAKGGYQIDSFLEDFNDLKKLISEETDMAVKTSLGRASDGLLAKLHNDTALLNGLDAKVLKEHYSLTDNNWIYNRVLKVIAIKNGKFSNYFSRYYDECKESKELSLARISLDAHPELYLSLKSIQEAGHIGIDSFVYDVYEDKLFAIRFDNKDFIIKLSTERL